jgi:hypothetical protein
MLGNLIDRFVGIFAPMAGFQRSIARAELRAFQAAAKDRKNADWVAKNQSADLAIVTDAATLNARSRQMMRDSHIAKAIKLSKGPQHRRPRHHADPDRDRSAGNELVELNEPPSGLLGLGQRPGPLRRGRPTELLGDAGLASVRSVAVGEAFFVKTTRRALACSFGRTRPSSSTTRSAVRRQRGPRRHRSGRDRQRRSPITSGPATATTCYRSARPCRASGSSASG